MRKPLAIDLYCGLGGWTYLELFARRQRPGWSVWGDEVASDVTLPPQLF